MSERLDVHLHFHVAPETLEFLRSLKKEMHDMRQSLLAASAASVTLVGSITDLNTAYAAYMADEGKRRAAAVAEALAADGADEDTIAAAIQKATDDANAELSKGLAAIHAGTSQPTPPDVSTLPTTPDATDTPAGGLADDSVNGGNGSDSVSGAASDDSLGGGQGSDSLTGGQGSDGVTAADNANPSSVPADPEPLQAADPTAPAVSGSTADPNA